MILTKTTISSKAFGIFPSGYSTRTGTNGLEIGVGDTSHLLYAAQHGCAHTIAARHILGSALQQVTGVLRQFLAQGNGVVVITAVRHSDEAHTLVQRRSKPQVMQAIFRHTDDDGYLIIRADLCKRTRRIAGRLHDEDAFLILVHACEDGISLRFLE